MTILLFFIWSYTVKGGYHFHIKEMFTNIKFPPVFDCGLVQSCSKSYNCYQN